MKPFAPAQRIACMLVLLLLLLPGALSGKERLAGTPPPGSSERREILDALRKEIFRLHRLDVVFVVGFLKAQDGWAWAETLPQSPDGRSRYEGVSALLRKSGGRWRIAELACSEPDNPECLDSPDYFRKLNMRFPALPVSVLPPGSATGGTGK
ncbi:MAG: hypothetical protein WCE98_07975 [Chlorobium sp.]